ncbi:hypothetical protein MNBD_PLANCTO02-454 [hydrothermal vent metagenome]|uniref:RNA polymerase sigma-70 region 2 domain-containing protein n=1 Tax=hydrothermal vent metagenome TaxID=652676 RepID=A0A3B1DZE9_9ZZZZ
MTQHTITKEFIKKLTCYQGQMYTYILSLVGKSNDARDVLQETNKSILEKASDFMPGTSFSAWASKIAFFKVLSYQRDEQRKSALFSGETLKEISRKTIAANEQNNREQHDSRLDLLRDCVKKLPDDRQRLLNLRYEEEIPLEEIASRWGRSYNAMAALLYRMRLSLMDCVQRSLDMEERP